MDATEVEQELIKADRPVTLTLHKVQYYGEKMRSIIFIYYLSVAVETSPPLLPWSFCYAGEL